MSRTTPAMYKSRAPVINPFDKLNQNQFDSYVSSIQAKIQVALNPPSPEPQHVSRTFAEISHSTIASPAPSPAPLSKRPSQEPHDLPKLARSPLGAGTPNEPFELSDDEEDTDELAPNAQHSGSQSASEVEAEAEPLSAIQEGAEEEEEEEVQTDGADFDGYDYAPQDEGEWGYSGEDASEDDELSGPEEAEEEEDTFVGKGKGRHPAEGPGLAALLNSSSASAHRAGGSAQTPERSGRSMRTLDDSFDEGVGRMPVLGTTSTPFVSRLAGRRSRSPHTDSGEDEDDAGSPPWEADPGLSMPAVAVYEGSVESDEEDEASSQEDTGLGAGHDTAIEVLDSDEEDGPDKDADGAEIDEIAPSPANTGGLHGEAQEPDSIYDGVAGGTYQEFDELEFDDSAAFPHQGHEPDSLLDDSANPDSSADISIKAGEMILPAPSSLFSGSSAFATREPSQSKDAEELDQSADTVQALERSVEDSYNSAETQVAVDAEPEPEHPSIQQSMDYSDFIGEHSLLNNSVTNTQVEENFLEVTVYELENGSRYYDYDGTRHFLNPEGEVYETRPIPPPRPTIQQQPDLSIIEEVTEYDMTRRMVEDDEPKQFDFLQGFDDTFSSAGNPVLHYPDEDDSFAHGMDDIPQRPGAALGFRARDAPGEDASAFLSESAIIGDDESEVGEQHSGLGTLKAENSFASTMQDPMEGRRAGDLISEADDIVSASEPEGDADADSQDSILDDEDESTVLDKSGLSALINREDLITPVPPLLQDQVDEDQSGVEPQLDEKSVADALAAVAELAEAVSFGQLMNGGDTQDPGINDAMFGNLEQDSPNLENLMNEVSNMSSTEEDILARSFNMADALQDTSASLGDFPGLDGIVIPNGVDLGTVVESSVPGEVNFDTQVAPPVVQAPEKLASEVLAEVFEGYEDDIGLGTGPPTPADPITRVPELAAHIEEVEERSCSPTPVPSHPPTTESPNPSPRRTPPTPTLSRGQSLTAPELSIATSISEASAMQPNVSVYEGSPTSSTHREDLLLAPPPADSDTIPLPDPSLPPAPTHLSTPAAPGVAPDTSEARRNISPSVMVEPPTPHTRSEDGTADSVPKELLLQKEAESDTGSEKRVAAEENNAAEGADQDEDVDVVGTVSDGASTPKRKSRSPSQSDSKQPSEPKEALTPEGNTRVGDKRKRLTEDPPSPSPAERTPSKSSVKSPNRSNGLVRSPLSESAHLPATPTSRRYQNLFKRTPSIKPLSTASESSSRKTSGSDRGGPVSAAPWPMRHRTHNHASAARASNTTSPSAPRASQLNSSPVTRSNCRFHKITIPADDDDDSVKVEFIVPGCALGNHEVLKEQRIEDCGPSSTDDESAMVTDLGDLEPRIVNKLTILVGVSLFNESVCGYLEKPSVPKVSRSVPVRSKSLKGSWRKTTAEIKAELSAEDKDRSKTASPAPKSKPRSRTSISHDDRLYQPPADGTESEGSAEAEPTRKRLRKRSTLGGTSSVKFPTLGQDSPQKPASVLSSQPTESRVRISGRMKRARRPVDAQTFKPEPIQDESSPDDEAGSPRKRHKRQPSTALSRTNSRTNSSAPSQSHKALEDEGDNPFRPKFELKRMLSPEGRDKERQQSVFAAPPHAENEEPTAAEQKDLEQHVALGDHPGEVVDEDGSFVNVKELSDPAPAKVAAFVDRDAPSEIGKKESNSAGENALGAKSVGKKGWTKFFHL
ncbi:hypothetical protein BDV93DRAFT_603085 [Ceratobasidium sp. AG-I]|nr:hypothetical protein BDV93DRAFT_603085 [Ceratobasidium sp. AG-I]